MQPYMEKKKKINNCMIYYSVMDKYRILHLTRFNDINKLKLN